jgi:hypothetical protein
MQTPHGRSTSQEERERFGKGLKRARERRRALDPQGSPNSRGIGLKNLTQAQLEDLIAAATEREARGDPAGKTIASWESGRRFPDPTNLSALGMVLEQIERFTDEESDWFAQAQRKAGIEPRRLCAILAAPLRSTFWSVTVGELVAVCREANPRLDVQVYAHDEQPDLLLRDLRHLRNYYAHDLAGIVVAMVPTGTDTRLLQDLASELASLHAHGQVPIVQIDRYLEFADGTRAPYHFVGLADEEVAAEAVSEFVKNDHQPEDILGVFDLLTEFTQVRTRRGFIKALCNAGLSEEQAEAAALAYPNRAVMQSQSQEHDWRAIGRLVEDVLRNDGAKRITGIVAATSYIAREVQRVMQTLDLERARAARGVGSPDQPPLIEQIRLISLDGAPRPEFVHELNFVSYTPHWLATKALELLRSPQQPEPQECIFRDGIVRRTLLTPVKPVAMPTVGPVMATKGILPVIGAP